LILFNLAMKTIRLALVSLATAFGSLVSFAQQTQDDAFVSSVTGSATVLTPGAAAAVPAVAGQKLPQGSTVKTGDGGSVLIQSHEGIQTGIGAKSSVVVGAHSVSSDGIRTAVIDLKQGTTVSVLDPSKRAVNNYAVRTPKGVAAARGTTYSTTVTLSSGGEAVVTVNTLTGAVSFSIVGGATVSVTAGNSANSGSTTSTTIATAIASASPSEQADITEALKATVSVAAIVAQASAVTGDTNANTTLQSVVAAVTTAANEVSSTNATLANAIVTNTVVSVQQFAGENAAAAVATVQSTSNTAVQAAADNAAAAPAAPVQVVVAPATANTPQTISTPDAPATPSTPPQPTPDITVTPSPSS
jgi:hypothetical protein